MPNVIWPAKNRGEIDGIVLQMPFAMSQPVPAPQNRPENDLGRQEKTVVRSISRSTPLDLRHLHFHKLNHDAPTLPKQKGTVILDLEDGVSSAERPHRRLAIQHALSRPLLAGTDVLIRCNGMDDLAEMITDIQLTANANLAGYILPMVHTAEQVMAFDRLLGEREKDLGLRKGHLSVHLLVELPEAFLALGDLVAASPRVASVMFGKEDFLSRFPTGSDRAADFAEAQIPLMAAAAGIPAIASPFITVSDLKGFERYCHRSRDLGYTGVLTIHPKQRVIADDVFGISALDLQSARALIEGSKDAQLVRLNDKLVGPPMRKRAASLLARAESHTPQDSSTAAMNSTAPIATESTASPTATAGTQRKGRFPRYGIDTTTAQVGTVLKGANVFTLDDGFRTKWFSHFPTSDAVLTSKPAARAMGHEDRPLPFSLLLNLCLCLSVDAFSRTCRYHLGLRDARQVAPVRQGDTVRAMIRVESMRNTSSGDAAVIVSTHMLVNQDGRPVFVLTKDSYYDPIPGLEERETLPREGRIHAKFDSALAAPNMNITPPAQHVDSAIRWQEEHLWGSTTEPAYIPPSLPVEDGEVILHPAVRPIGWSENLELTTLVRNTHSIHFDAQHYGREGIVVCGGFVQAMMQGLASPELCQVIDERLIHSFHTGTVMPEDRIGAISKVLSVSDVGDDIEEVVVSTVGLINVDIEQELIGVDIPDVLFGPDPVKPAALRALCASECPVLENRIAMRAIRVLRRLKA